MDAAIGIPALDQRDVRSDHLLDMPYVGVCADGHPRLSDAPDLDELAREEFVVVAKALGHEHVVRRLVDLGFGDAITITLPHFAVLAQTLAVTEHVACQRGAKMRLGARI